MASSGMKVGEGYHKKCVDFVGNVCTNYQIIKCALINDDAK